MLRAALFMLLIAAVPVRAWAGGVLDQVRQSGHLACGSVTEPADDNKDDTHGRTAALGADICRAVAAALLGDANRATVFGFHDEREGMMGLQRHQIALLVGASPNPGMAARYGVTFGQPVFFDGQGFLVRRNTGIASLADLAGKPVCFIGGTQAEADARRAMAQRGIAFHPFPFEEMGEMEAALVTGHCSAQTGDVSALGAGRSGFHGQVSAFVLLPETITLDPLSPVMLSGDADWQRVVDWVGYALVQAEIAGVTADNAEALSRTGDDQLRTLLGTRRSADGGLGMPPGWGLRAIRAVGNYGEMFDRDLGAHSPCRPATRPEPAVDARRPALGAPVSLTPLRSALKSGGAACPRGPARSAGPDPFPGSSGPAGRGAAFMVAIRCSSTADLWRAASSRRSTPTPCSADIDPPRSATRSCISRLTGGSWARNQAACSRPVRPLGGDRL